MSPPKNLKELQGLQGRVVYIRRFISNLAGHYHPFSHLMKKGRLLNEVTHVKRLFDNIKWYLLIPLVLGAPIFGNLRILYIRGARTFTWSIMAQENPKDKEGILYYLIRRLVGAKLNYSPIKSYAWLSCLLFKS